LLRLACVLRAKFSDKYLKNWYPLPMLFRLRVDCGCLPKRRVRALRVSWRTPICANRQSTGQNRKPLMTDMRHPRGMHNECAK
jgi:hypothetical protein